MVKGEIAIFFKICKKNYQHHIFFLTGSNIMVTFFGEVKRTTN